jgi:hypothetical protein
MLDADPNTYVEFDMTEKLKGSFEERAAIYQSACGAPYLTRDEVRSELNLAPLPEGQGEQIITPLNVTEGGQASPQDTQGKPYNYPGEDNNGKKLEPCGCKSCKTEELRIKGRSDKEDDEKVADVLAAFFKRQARSVLPKIGAEPEDYWDGKRWDKELTEDLEPVLVSIADKHGKAAAETLGSEYITEKTTAYLHTAATKRAEKINEGTLKAIEKELERELEDDEDDHDISKVYDTRENAAGNLAKAAAGAIASFAIGEAAHQAISEGAPRVVGRIVEKEWVTGENARESHQAMNGERVPIDADFSNGQHWPGEDIGDPSESCGCNCTTEIVITGG